MLPPPLPGLAAPRGHAYVPPLLAALVDAVDNGARLEPGVEAVARHLGFDSFHCAATHGRPDHREHAQVFTTLPDAWIARYEKMAYAEVDPQVALTSDRAVPLIWDQPTLRGRTPRTDAFLDDALRHGIGSGVCFTTHGPRNRHVLIALHSSVPRNDEIRLRAIARNLPDIVVFGLYFHERFLQSAIELPPRAVGAPFSKRERACLELAASGHTTDDIAVRLAITSRTVQFHFDSIRTKLGAANRQQAIAMAVHTGIVRAG